MSMGRVTLSNIKISLASAKDPKWHSLKEDEIQKIVVSHIRDAMRPFCIDDSSFPLIANPQSTSKKNFSSAAQANAWKSWQIDRGFTKSQSDLIIPLTKAHKWPVLALEIKKHDSSPFKINGQTKASKGDHLIDQAKTLANYQNFGWCAFFTVGLYETLKVFYDVLGNVEPPSEVVQVEYKCKYLGNTKYFDLQRLNY